VPSLTVAEGYISIVRICARTSILNLKRWKVIRSTITTVAVFGLAVFAIDAGAEPTSTAIVALLVAAALNGVDLMELASIWREVETERAQIEASGEQSSTETRESGAEDE